MAKFFLTTAIDYANGDPHLGHALEKIGADVIARYHRLAGDDVHFLMGMDEHGQKVKQAADECRVSPQTFVDRVAATFEDMWRRLAISNDQFIRTTDPAHNMRKAVQGIREAGASGTGPTTRVVAVTLLTSLDPAAMPPGFSRPFDLYAAAAALTEEAERAGALGVVCAAADLAGLRSRLGRAFFAVTPGIRPAGADAHDQKRVATVESAVRDGASLLVLGRAVTGSGDPAAALAAAREERDRAVVARAGAHAGQ